MDIAQLLVTPILVMFVSLVGGYLFKDRLDRIEVRLDRLPNREEFEALVALVSRLESEVAALRSDITQVALAVGARVRPQTG